MTRTTSPRRRRTPTRTRKDRPPLYLERLEDRMLLSANDFPPIDTLGINDALLGNHDPTPMMVNGQNRFVIAGEWLAKFDNLSGQTRADQLASAKALLQNFSGMQVIDHTGSPGLVVIQTAADVPQDAVNAALASVQGFDYVEPYFVDYGPKQSVFWVEDDIHGGGSGASGSAATAPSGSASGSPAPSTSTTNVKVLNGFDGINYGQSGGWTPPDTDGAVGPNSFLQNVNSSIAIYNKTTGAVIAGPTSVNTFWAPENESGAFFSDPVAVYDEFASKFVVVEGNFNNNHVFVAVSKSSNPTLASSDWNFYKYTVNDNAGMDYPKIGYNKDGYVLTYNMFPYYYDHSDTLSIRKSDMAGFVNVVPGGFTHFTLAPATMHTSNPGDPMWFVEDGHTGGGGSTVNVVKMTNPYSNNPTFTTYTLNVNPYGDAPNPRQPGGDLGYRTSLGTRFFFSGLRQVGSQTLLVSADAVGANGGSQVRWYEFDVAPSTGPKVVQQGAINQGTGIDTFYPDVDIAAGGTLGMTFDQSSATASSGYMSMYVTGRNPGDSSGTMETPALAKQGIGFLNAGGRGGDYSFTSIDPADGTFWATNEYAPQYVGNWNWATYIAHFRVAPPAGPSVVGQTPSGDSFGTANSVRLTFDEPIQPSSFDTTKIVSFTGPGGAINVTGVTDVAGSGDTQFDLSFAQQSALGNYTLVVGPNILDAAGHPMDQNHNGIAGESGIAPAGDEYQGTFTLQGLKVLSSTPSGNFLPNTVTDVTLTFNEAVNPSTFTTGQVAFTGPAGAVGINSITALDSTNTRWDVNFNAPTATGLYKMVIGPNVQDTFGHKMDQNGNFIPGEPGDTYTAQFGVTGPKVTAVSGAGGSYLPGQFSTMRVYFDRSMDPTTVGTGDLSITDPNGASVNVNSVTAVNGSNNTQFDFQFDPAGVTGHYNVTVGPNPQDTFGNKMDQNGNLIPGEPGDVYKTTFTVVGPRVNSYTPQPANFGPGEYSSVRLFFNERMDATVFTKDKIASLTDPSGNAIPVTGVFAVGGSNNTTFDVTFSPQTAVGIYKLVVGANVQDQYGNQMDQNGNLKTGEVPGDQYTASFALTGPRVIAVTPTGNSNLPGVIDHVRVTFNEAMDASTFSPDSVSSSKTGQIDVFDGPNGSLVTVNDVSPVANTGATQFDVSFDPLTTTGFYTLVLGPHVKDLYGNEMDQDNNLKPGEPSDAFRTTFGVAGPRVLSATRALFTPVTTVHVVFSESMDPTTFTTSQIVSFKDPTGKDIRSAVTGISPTTDDNSQFDITLNAQAAVGNYTMTLGSGIQDAYGNKMDQNGNLVPGETPGDQYTFQFRAVNPIVGPDGFGYTADGTYGYEDHDISGLPGTFTIIQYAYPYSSYTPSVDLGTNTFNFYGKTYTGNNQLYVSPYGLVSFGSGVPYSYNYYDLTSYPQEAVIAPLWDNWYKYSFSGPPMVMGRFEDTTGSGKPDRLVIQWNQVQNYYGYYNNEKPVTFQLILGLNTDPTTPSPITFNYNNLDTGDYLAHGYNSVVGIKDVGYQGANRMLIAYHEGVYPQGGTSPFLQDQQAIQITAPSTAGTIQGTVYQDDTGSGVKDPNWSGLSGATVYLDLNRTGTYDPNNDPTATTDDSGNYSFTGVVPGSYAVGVVPPDGSVLTKPKNTSRTLDDFESTGSLFGNYSQYSYYSQYWAKSAAAAHDGGMGLTTTPYYSNYHYADWIYRNDTTAHVQQGDTISAWVQFNQYDAYGRAYLGFGASANGTLSLVLAPNTNQLMFEQNQYYAYEQPIGSVTQTFQPSHWYRVEVQWDVGGKLTGRLYDSDGTTLLNTVTANSTLFTSGGLAFRAYNYYGGGVYFDTVTAGGIPGEYSVSVGLRQTVTVGDFAFYFPPSGASGPLTASLVPGSGGSPPSSGGSGGSTSSFGGSGGLGLGGPASPPPSGGSGGSGGSTTSSGGMSPADQFFAALGYGSSGTGSRYRPPTE